MRPHMNRILVIGGTGRTGRQVFSQLPESGVRIRALVRKPEAAGLPADVDVVRWPYLAVPTAPIDERDIAAVAVRALCEDGHAGAEYVLTGPESLSQGEQIVTIGEAIGRTLRVEELSPEEARSELAAIFPP